MFKRIGATVAVFMAGFVVAMNLITMKYGVPAHYDAGWSKVVIACFLAILFGAYLVINDD